MKSRPVKDCPILVLFTRKFVACKQEMMVGRFPTEEKAEQGIETAKKKRWHAMVAVQGRERKLNGIEEGTE